MKILSQAIVMIVVAVLSILAAGFFIIIFPFKPCKSIIGLQGLWLVLTSSDKTPKVVRDRGIYPHNLKVGQRVEFLFDVPGNLDRVVVRILEARFPVVCTILEWEQQEPNQNSVEFTENGLPWPPLNSRCEISCGTVGIGDSSRTFLSTSSGWFKGSWVRFEFLDVKEGYRYVHPYPLSKITLD